MSVRGGCGLALVVETERSEQRRWAWKGIKASNVLATAAFGLLSSRRSI